MALNLYKMMPTHLQTPQRTYDAFDELRVSLPFRAGLIGGSGKGKSQLALNLYLRMGAFKRIIFIIKKHEEPLILWWKEIIEQQQQRDPEIEVIEGTEFSDLPRIDTLDKEDPRNTLLVLDDVMLDDNQAEAMKFFIRGRSVNVSIMYLAQKFKQIPLVTRLQMTHIFLLEVDSVPEAKRILREYGDVDELYPMYAEIIKTPWSWLLIDCETRLPELKYRQDFGDMEANKRLPIGDEEEPKLLEEKKDGDGAGLSITKPKRKGKAKKMLS
jgi:hypothetical protein